MSRLPELAELARLRHEVVELLAELEEVTDPTRELVDAFGQRFAAIRAGLDAIEATS